MAQLDGLRTLAVVAVVWSHWVPHEFHFGLPWGTGVQLFFVLSGFLITGILLDNRPDGDNAQPGAVFLALRRFYARRFLRIFPLFYLVLVVAVVFNVDSIRAVWPWHFGYLSNVYYYLMGPDGFDHFGHFWSLAVEEQFYLVWPFLVLLLPRRALRWALFGLILVAPVFRAAISGIAPDPQKAHYLPLSCLDALGIGALFALVIRAKGTPQISPRALARFCLWVGVPGTLVVGYLMRAHLASPAVASAGHLFMVLFYGWVVFTAANGFPGIVGRVLEWGPMVYLGRISYGLYVYHLFSELCLPTVYRWLHVAPSWEASVGFRLAVQTALTLAVAVVSWHVFEKPLNDLKRFFPYPKRAGK